MDSAAIEGGWVDLRRRLVLRGDDKIKLTAREADLLRYLVDRPGQVVGFDELLREVWRYAPSVVSRAPYFTWRRLVNKVEADPAHPVNLVARHGDGVSYQPAGASHAPAAHRLSVPTTSFVGRSAELRAVQDTFAAGARWITLAGPGGAGKTRLAQQLSHLDGTSWRICDLSEAHTEPEIVARVAAALGVPYARLIQALSFGPPLILDSCEHAPERIAARAEQWLREAAGLRLITTSRVALAGQGEHVIVVGPLHRDDAIALFEQRARAADHRFDAGVHRADVRRLVEDLDALPLALELAAARVRVLPPGALRARLAHDLGVLATRSRGPERQRSLAATLDWSWSLLDPGQQRALEALSVFRAGATEAAIAGILDLPGDESVLDLIEALVEHNLLTVQAESWPPRYAPYAVVQSHARDRLEARADHEEVCQRHAAWFAALAPGQWFEGAPSVTAELPNLLGAIERAHSDEMAVQAGLRAVAVLSESGPLEDALALCLRLQPRARDPAAAWLEALRARVLGRLGHNQEVVPIYEALLERARALGEQALEAIVLLNLASASVFQGDLDRADAHLAGATTLAHTIGYVHGEIRAANLRCLASARRGAWDRARAWAQEALALALAARDASGAHTARSQIARTQLSTGDAAGAVASYRELLAQERTCENLHNLSLSLAVQGHLEEAAEQAAEAIARARQRGRRELLIQHLVLRAQVALELEDTDQALACATEAAAIAERLGRGAPLADATCAVVAARAGRRAQAIALLQRAGDARPGRAMATVPLELLRAEVEALVGDDRAASAALHRALALATAEGLHPSFFAPSWARLASLLGG